MQKLDNLNLFFPLLTRGATFHRGIGARGMFHLYRQWAEISQCRRTCTRAPRGTRLVGSYLGHAIKSLYSYCVRVRHKPALRTEHSSKRSAKHAPKHSSEQPAALDICFDIHLVFVRS